MGTVWGHVETPNCKLSSCSQCQPLSPLGHRQLQPLTPGVLSPQSGGAGFGGSPAKEATLKREAGDNPHPGCQPGLGLGVLCVGGLHAGMTCEGRGLTWPCNQGRTAWSPAPQGSQPQARQGLRLAGQGCRRGGVAAGQRVDLGL